MLTLMKTSWETGFRAAKDSAKLSNGRVTAKKTGSALMSGNKVVSIGYNIFGKTHPSYQDIDEDGEDFLRNSHAELMCLVRRRHHDSRNLTIYIWRELDNGLPANSRPCKFCRKLIKEYGVRKIRFIDEGGQFVEERIREFE
jgi:hypothetical protein